MLEWLAPIATAELGKVVFEQTLKLGQTAAEDYVKDFFKGCLKDGVAATKPEVAKKAVAAALQAFLLLIEDELLDRDVSKVEIRDRYEQPLLQFIKNDGVKPLLGKAFEPECRQIDAPSLHNLWQQSTFKDGKPFPAMPTDFNWQRVGDEYVRKVRRIVRETPELRSLLETKLLEDIARNTSHISPGFNVAQYRASLQSSYGYLRLSTVDTTDQQYRIRLWQMFIEQTVRESLPPSRYDLPLDIKRQLQAEGQLEGLSPEAWERSQQDYWQQPARKVLEVLVDAQRAVILGDPGAGKSTLLQYLALEWVEGKTTALPILIELREYAIAQSPNFLDFLHRGRGVDWQFDQQQLHEYLQDHPTLVMFDGLDEVFDLPTQATIIDDIIRFAQQYPKAQILVTSRIIGYSLDRFRHAEFRQFTIQPLDRDEIHEFIDRWYDLAMGNDADKERLKQRLKDAIANSTAIANLADNPLLLTMMAILNRRQELPRDRADLYDQASRVLLYHWDVDHKRLNLPMDAIGRREKQEMLRAIAYEMQAAESGLQGNLISSERLTRSITDYLRDQGFSEPREKANRLIQQLRERNFILCYRGSDTYGFVHRTFLEYFCAMEIVHRFEKQRTLTFEQLRDEVFGQHWQDETWHEVLRLICGAIDPRFAGDLIEFLIFFWTHLSGEEDYDDLYDYLLIKGGIENMIFAAKCLREVSRQTEVRTLSQSLISKLQEIPEHINDYCKSCCDEDGNEDLTQLDIHWMISGHAQVVEAVASICQDEPNVCEWLKNEALYGNFPEIRTEAIRGLVNGRMNLDEMIEFLSKMSVDTTFTGQEDWSDTPRLIALKALLANYPTHPKTFELLRDRAINDPDEQLRAWAQEQLKKIESGEQ